MNPQQPVLITPVDEHMGLDIARSLGRKGVTVYGMDANAKSPGCYSKYIHFIPGADPEVEDERLFVQSLIQFGQQQSARTVLYPLSDRHALVVSQYRGDLQPYFDFVMPDHQTIEEFATKDGLLRLARQFNVPAPASFFIENLDHLHNLCRQLQFPAILKPTESTYWHTEAITRLLRRGFFAGRAKVIYCPDEKTLLEAYQTIAAHDDRMIVQEVIPGEDEALVYLAVYFNRQSQPLGYIAGRKHRIIPTGFGSASYVRTIHDPELIDLGISFLQKARYQGHGGIEFKKDPRDGLYKLIEVNTRFGMWDGLSVLCGVDLPYLSYCDATGQPVPPRFEYQDGLIWIDWQRDLRAAWDYRKQHKLTAAAWLRSIRGKKMSAIYDRDDWRPGFRFTLGLAQKAFDRLNTNSRSTRH
mgnify:FL=1